jgi:cytidine deaminase
MKSITSFDQIDDLDSESKYLVHKAKEAAQHAYAPYSKFFVGAALILDDGAVITGCNQENASYPLCMCAERVALFTAASQSPGRHIKKIAIAAHKKNHKELVQAPPCGACRQVLIEMEQRQKENIQVVMLGSGEKWMVCPSASILLPHDFNMKSLS